jgi:hydrogenase nickel incorporation protein HypA/HybF
MHEFGIMQETMTLVLEQARRQGATCVHQVRMNVGQLSGVVPEALQACFEVLREGTLAASARLDIETVPAICWCKSCGSEFETPDLLCECPRCRAISGELRRGRELQLASLEIS